MKNTTILIVLSALIILPIPFVNQCYAFEYDRLDELLNPEPEKTISMDFTNAALNNVLKIFSQQSGLNFIAATDVASKTVNLYLDNVPVEEALERILSANNLTYEIKPDSNIFIVNEIKVSPIQLMTRVYPLKFATVPSSQLHSTFLITNRSSQSGSSSTRSSQSSSSTTTGNQSSGIIAAVQAVLSDDGTVVEDLRTNSLIVSDIPSQFPLIEQTITRLDVRVPQILIEVEMLDISAKTADLMGAKFGDTPITFTGAERDHVYPFNQNDLLRKGYTFAEPEYRVGTLSFKGLAITLQFLRTQTDTKNLARPRILTLNNNTAEIAISTDEAIGLSSTTTSSEGTASSVAEAERVKTGVFLKVTPQANLYTREITMAIEPKVIQARTGATFSGQTFKDPEERGTKSILRVNDGDTVVLGGLLRTDLDHIVTSVPILGKIPIIGAPFRHKDKTATRRELIIFITPHIVDENRPLKISSSRGRKIVREQSIPSSKHQAIEQELSYFESQNLNAYK